MAQATISLGTDMGIASRRALSETTRVTSQTIMVASSPPNIQPDLIYCSLHLHRYRRLAQLRARNNLPAGGMPIAHYQVLEIPPDSVEESEGQEVVDQPGVEIDSHVSRLITLSQCYFAG